MRKTAYGMRISDWSSDVCSSDLLVADEFGGDVIGDAGAEAFAVALIFGQARAAEIFALGDIFHLGRDDAAAGVVHLADVLPRLGAEDLAADVGEGGDAAAAVGTELAVVLGPHLALGDPLRSADRRVGNECVSMCSSRGSQP